MFVKSALLSSEIANERWTLIESYLLVEWVQESNANVFIIDMWIDDGCEGVMEVHVG